MNLFRSEEHIEAWLGGRTAGATISVSTLCDLAHAWWADRLSPEWRRRTPDEAEAIFQEIGLTGEFWSLRP